MHSSGRSAKIVTNMDIENFGVDSKYVRTFMDIAHGGTIEYRDKIHIIHTHSLFFQEI